MADFDLVDTGQALGLDPVASCWLAVDQAEDDQFAAALDTLERLRADIARTEEYVVRRLRAAPASWAVIGHHLGISATAAHKKYRHIDPPKKPPRKPRS